MKYTVISIEDNTVRLETEDEEDCFIKTELLPSGIKEGDILFFDGNEYVIDVIETEKRRKAVYEKFNRLFCRE